VSGHVAGVVPTLYGNREPPVAGAVMNVAVRQ